MLMWLVASSSIAQSTSSDMEQKEANQLVLRCIYKYSVQLDDGASNAEIVAKAAANSCRRESEEFVDVLIRGVFPIDRQKILQAKQIQDVEAGIHFVLSSRAEKRKGQ